MKKPDCSKCHTAGRWCGTYGFDATRVLRERIKELRAALAIVSKCPKRQAWDAAPKWRRP